MSKAEIEVFSPVTGQLLKSYPVTAEHVVSESLAAARVAAGLWADESIKERLCCLSPLKQKLINEIDSLTEQLVNVTGKVKTDVLLGEIYPLLEMLSYYQQNAEAILAPQPVTSSPLAFPDATAYYQYKPYGVVAVISPWNYPFQLTLYPLLSALIAGNAVIFKTSELSLPVGELIMELLADLELPDHLVQWVVGGPQTGRCLIDQRPDLVFFTGGIEAGRQIMAQAAQHPVPVMLELGGKDAMLVFADAQLDRAVNAALYGAFLNAGQVCVAIELLYVEETIFSRFMERLNATVAKLTVGHGDKGDIGAMTSQHQIAIIKAQYEDALSKGAQASGPLKITENYVYPVILWNIKEDMRVYREESFGPLLPVLKFNGESSLLDSLAACDYGLNASIWSRDVKKAEALTQQLKVGNWAINDVIKNVGHPRLPFGGVGNSGFGRYHGAEGLRSFTCIVSGLVSRSRFLQEPNWFPYSERSFRAMKALVDMLFANDSLWLRLKRNGRELRYFQQYAGLNLRQHWYNFLIFLRRNQN